MYEKEWMNLSNGTTKHRHVHNTRKTSPPASHTHTHCTVTYRVATDISILVRGMLCHPDKTGVQTQEHAL